MLKKIRKKLPRKLRDSKVWEAPSSEAQQRLAFEQELVWQQKKQKRVPSWRQFKYISSFFSARERFLVSLSSLAIIVGVLMGGYMTYLQFVEIVPANGGAYSEALIGYPLYINPILANTNDIDLDLTSLLFAGLLEYDQNLDLQPNLAESWEVSEDGKIYTLTLRENLKWHDGEPLTIDDVLFTYKAIQEPAVNSPLLLSMQDITVSRIDDRTVEFELLSPFKPFESVLTVGIIPEHLWSNLPASNIRLAELNIKPIGSGAWEFSKLEKDKQGNIHSYTLIPFDDYHDQSPYIETLTFRFYPDFDTAIEALNNNKVEGMSFLPRQLISSVTNAQAHKTHHLQLPQYTSIFFNQEENADLKDKAVRQALAYSIDRDRLVNDVLDGLGQKVNGPLLPGLLGYDPEFEGYPYNPVEAQRLLSEAGWEEVSAEEYIASETERIQSERQAAAEEANGEDSGPLNVDDSPIVVDTGNQAVFRKKDDSILEIRLTTVDQPENRRAAEIIQNAWQSIGFKVQLDIVPVNLLTSTILPSRDYDALLYGQILNAFPDLYAFWHSSQVEYPGLNLAGYADGDADELLEKARESTSTTEQVESYRTFQTQLIEDLPALFLFTPQYTYLMPIKIKGFDVDQITVPADRWSNINDWYIRTKREWK